MEIDREGISVVDELKMISQTEIDDIALSYLGRFGVIGALDLLDNLERRCLANRHSTGDAMASFWRKISDSISNIVAEHFELLREESEELLQNPYLCRVAACCKKILN